MKTIYAVSRDGKERYDTVEDGQVAKRIKILQHQGWLKVRVLPSNNI